MKKALIVANTLGLVEAFLGVDIETLENLGYEVHLACNAEITDPSHEDWRELHKKIAIHHANFPVRNLAARQLVECYFSLKIIMRMLEPDVVHCHTSIASVLARQAASRLKKKPFVIYTSHGFPFYEGCGKSQDLFYRSIESHYSRKTDAIITICKEDYENAQRMHCPIVFLTHGMGISSDRYDEIDFDHAEFRHSLGVSDDAKIVLSIGEICTNKNHEVVIRALSIIDNEGIVYIICGREVSEQGKRAELEKLAEDLGVDVIFLGYRKDVGKICRVADIGALPSFKEGLGLGGIEMLAAGIPVVGSSRQGVKDYIEDGVTGFLCNPESPESFAVGIEKALALAEDVRTTERCKKAAIPYRDKEAHAESRDIISSLLSSDE